MNLVVFFASLLSNFDGVIDSYGMKPAEMFAGMKLHTLVTSMFLHGGILHIFGNMLYLWIFGDNVEDNLGRAGFLLFYFGSGFVASFIHALSDPSSMIPTIGASGAISGVLGAYVVFFPRTKVYTAVGVFYFWRIVAIPAVFFIGFWFVLQVLSASILLVSGVSYGIAYWAHIGGFIAGLLLVLPFWRRLKKRGWARHHYSITYDAPEQ